MSESTGKDVGSFLLWSDAPRWEYSTAPLTYSDGIPLPGPKPGDGGGHAIYLNDQQVWCTIHNVALVNCLARSVVS